MIRSHGPATAFVILAAFLIGCAEEPAKQAADSIATEPAKEDASGQHSNSSDGPPTAGNNEAADFEELVKIAN